MTLGCLNKLLDLGLVSEVSHGQFKRVNIREKQPQQADDDQYQPEIERPTMTIKTQTQNPIDRLSSLAKRLRDLATDMETAALDLAEQSEKNEKETEKMRQLQALLKSLG